MRPAKKRRKNRAKLSEAQAKAFNARLARKRRLSIFWRNLTGRETVEPRTLATVFAYIGEIPRPLILQWITRAAMKCAGDAQMGQYISGARRSHLKQQQELNAEGRATP